MDVSSLFLSKTVLQEFLSEQMEIILKVSLEIKCIRY